MFDRNLLLYGDNLDFLRDHNQFPTASVDLIYLDPPFNSNAGYNILFRDAGGEQSAAQIEAFDDTWRWDTKAAQSLAYLMQDEHAPSAVKALIQTFHHFLGHSPMLAYLVQMAARLVHMRRVLKDTGSLYLHCDPTASHYLKLVLDGIFGPENFLSEIVWKRTSAHSSAKRYGPVHDVILYYAATPRYVWNPAYTPYTEEYLETFFDKTDPNGRRWKRMDLTGAGVRHGETGKVWRGIDVTAKQRHWAYPPAELDRLDLAKKIHWPAKKGGVPRLKQYPEDLPGVPLQDIFADIRPLHNLAAERLGYPTQKPVALLKRIIAASSNPGDVILDPFCGCGTTIDATESLNREHPDQPPRRWVGIDITHLAINLIKFRLADRFDPPAQYEVRGEPKDIEGARQLFTDNPYQFQFWACGLVGARPAGAGSGDPKKGKKGADRGIDGERYFADDASGHKKIIVQVKGGKPSSAMVRDFRGTIEREGAALGIFVTLDDATKPMRQEAASAGVYTSPVQLGGVSVPRVQIVTIEELLSGGNPRQPAGVLLPPHADVDRTFKKAVKSETPGLFRA